MKLFEIANFYVSVFLFHHGEIEANYQVCEVCLCIWLLRVILKDSFCFELIRLGII
jgi:hypothetical protein